MATGAPITLVATTATLLRANRDHQNDQEVIVTNDTTGVLLLGGIDVSATQYGASLAAGAQLRLSMNPLDVVFGFATVAGTIHVFSSP